MREENASVMHSVDGRLQRVSSADREMSTISTNKSREPVKYEREGKRQVVGGCGSGTLRWGVMEDRGDDACGGTRLWSMEW